MRTASTLGRGGLDAKQGRGLARLDAAPESLLCGQEKMLVQGVGWNGHFPHLPPPVMIERTAAREAVTHMLCCSCAMCV